MSKVQTNYQASQLMRRTFELHIASTTLRSHLYHPLNYQM
ncbi:Uncharacterized protein BM_BM1316 [Brugia malayi]|uniref:Bm1316 n=1 Tax=Brugia malayi TaxID=6279 RepID=A0A0J9XUW2_BRUMA|nr:Uncharacterized protein BM_BM1316 [Brugia malayi]CDP95754.1 Bm1316 [Brugia malayi]VIO91095.1 Uncharacterized protein BM_BM1316 [Brugia malayi]